MNGMVDMTSLSRPVAISSHSNVTAQRGATADVKTSDICERVVRSRHAAWIMRNVRAGM